MRIRFVTLAAATTISALIGTQASSLAAVPKTLTLTNFETARATVNGEARIVDRSVVLRTEGGSLRVDDGRLRILDPNDTVIGSIPLTIVRQDTAFPIDARIDSGTATLTPRLDQGRPVTDAERRAAQPIAAADSPEDRMNTAMGNVNNELTVALAVGTLLGAIIGGPVGCVVLGLPTAGVGCPAGAVIGAGMGVVVFNLVIGVPALIASGVHFYNVMTAPPAPVTDAALRDDALAAVA